MKKIVCFLLAVSLMLSLSVCSFATPVLTPVDPNSPEYGTEFSGVIPYSLAPTNGYMWVLSGRSGDVGTWTRLLESDGIYSGSGAILTYVGTQQSNYRNSFYIELGAQPSTNMPYYWWNFIGKITDANGYVLKASDFNAFGVMTVSGNSLGVNVGTVTPASDNVYQWNDGYLQISLSGDTWKYSSTNPALFCNISNSNVVSPLSFEVEKFEAYLDEDSATSYPFVFGGSAHIDTSVPEGPKDPNDHSQYGSASDQVEWYNDAFGGAVDPELGDRMGEATDMLLQEQEIEDQVISGLNQYSSQVDPAILTFPTQIVNGLSFIGTTFMSSYNALGDIGFVISLSMMLGVVLVLIGRGEGALARGMAASARERRRTEYASKRDMDKGG